VARSCEAQYQDNPLGICGLFGDVLGQCERKGFLSSDDTRNMRRQGGEDVVVSMNSTMGTTRLRTADDPLVVNVNKDIIELQRAAAATLQSPAFKAQHPNVAMAEEMCTKV